MVSRVRPIPTEPPGPKAGMTRAEFQENLQRQNEYQEFRRRPENFNVPAPAATRVRRMIIEETGRVPTPAAVKRLQQAYALQDLASAQRIVAIARKQGVARIDAGFIQANLEPSELAPVAPVVTPAYTRYQLAHVMSSDPVPVAKAVGVAPSAKTEAGLRCGLKRMREILSSLPANRRLRLKDIEFSIQLC